MDLQDEDNDAARSSLQPELWQFHYPVNSELLSSLCPETCFCFASCSVDCVSQTVFVAVTTSIRGRGTLRLFEQFILLSCFLPVHASGFLFHGTFKHPWLRFYKKAWLLFYVSVVSRTALSVSLKPKEKGTTFFFFVLIRPNPSSFLVHYILHVFRFHATISFSPLSLLPYFSSLFLRASVHNMHYCT